LYILLLLIHLPNDKLHGLDISLAFVREGFDCFELARSRWNP